MPTPKPATDDILTLRLEILRAGSIHDTPLSARTPYLVLCGDHEPIELRLPFEHDDLLAPLRLMRAATDPATLEQVRASLARLMARLLGSLPSLLAELVRAHALRSVRRTRLVELRFVASGSELALLPLELAEMPIAMPGARQPLTLQQRLPVAVTRQLRRSRPPEIRWPERLKILFIATALPGELTVPFDNHLAALRRAVEPWVRFGATTAERERRVGERLVVLPAATLSQIASACRRQIFSHVHILAHGARLPGLDRSGLALHDAGDPEKIDVVDGQRLASALAGRVDDGASRPLVVTMASCDSAWSGDGLASATGVAQVLHDSGIPLVVASQFPLSVEGSAILVKTLYDDLAWGRDPRSAQVSLRRRLASEQPQHHDWASMVFFVNFPDDLSEPLRDFQIRQASESVRISLDWADRLIRHQRRLPEESWQKKLEEVARRLQRAKRRLEKLNQQDASEREPGGDFILGLLASVEKREAQVYYEAAQLTGGAEAMSLHERSRSGLERARALYRRIFEADLRITWAITQYLSLSLVLDRPEPRFFELFAAARAIGELDLELAQGRLAVWTTGSMIELFLLVGLVAPDPRLPSAAEAHDLAVAYAATLGRRHAEWPIDVYATRRQVLRYGEWFQNLGRIGADLLPTLDAVLALLPEIDLEKVPREADRDLGSV